MSRPHVVVLTGAGISAESGLATYRDAGGLWEGVSFEDVATPEAWARDPARVWRFYQLRRAQLGTVEPNPAHHALARLQRELGARGGRCTLITQNVDDLHQRAGAEVLAMHGELAVLRCEACGAAGEDREHTDPARFVPCGACGHERLRPGVVWFGEVPHHLERVQTAACHADLFLVVGTSGVVHPAAGLLGLARASGARTVVVGPEEPDNLHPRDEFVRGRAGEVLPGWVEAWLSGDGAAEGPSGGG